MEEAKQPAIRVFFSYAHDDMSLRDELEKHLGNLKRQGYITNWHDRDISAGKAWKQEIDKNLSESDIILLLVSPDFIHSDYCYGIEMKVALEKHKTEKARAIPIILRPVDWEDAPFSNLQALPTNAKPITTWLNRDEAFLDVTKGIRKVVKELLVEKYLDIAEELYDEEQLEKALTICERAIHLDSTAHKAYRLKMHLLTDLERYEEALSASQKVIDLIPNDADLYDDKAFILLKLNRHEEALDALEHAKDLDPLESHRYSSKGDALFSLARYEEALGCYQRAIDIVSPDGEWVYSKQKGSALFELGRYEEAATAYYKAFEGIPDGDVAADALKGTGDSFFKLGRYEEALASYSEAIELLEYCYGDTENLDFRDEAHRYIKGKGDALYKLKRYEDALATYQQAIDFAPETSEYYERRGEVLIQLKRFEDALTAYDHAIRLAPTTFKIYQKKAAIYEELAKQVIKSAIEIEFGVEIVATIVGTIYSLDLVSGLPSWRKVMSIRTSANTFIKIYIFETDFNNGDFSTHDIVTIYISSEEKYQRYVYINNHMKTKSIIRLPVERVDF